MRPVYSYESFRDYIRDWLAERSLKQSDLAWRMDCSPALISGIMNRRKKLAESYRAPMLRALRLKGRDAEIFTLLILSEDGTAFEQKTADDELAVIRRFESGHTLDAAEYELMFSWCSLAIIELARIMPLPDSPAWIGLQLQPEVATEEVHRAVALLKRVDWIVVGEDGLLRPAHEITVDRLKFDRDVQRDALHAIHRKALELTGGGLSLPPEEREYRMITVAIPEHFFPQARKMAQELQTRLMDACERALSERSDGEPARVYQLNLQLLPVSAALSPETETDG